ncbi:MAG TPA: flagellar motor protein MotB [Steroidobacteraceae bacterium]|nr:flagellar motor protein MotB [Steroidobacteraceae bacterium]
MAAEDKRPIIIVKRRKKGGHAHHGGAWKVAYADFVTALMAFFMVMWLVTAVSEEEKAAIFDYFKNPSMEDGRAPKPAPGQMGPGGASTSPINLRGGMDAPKSAPKTQDEGLGEPVKPLTMEEEEAREIAEAAERKQLESLMDDLKEAISESQALAPFKDQLLLDITPEGLRIQIVDEQNRPMFDLGGAKLKDYSNGILRELSSYLNSVPNRVSLTGHTDVKGYARNTAYGNWELSADRANAARRALVNGGMSDDKVARVVGLGSSVLFDKERPDNPINRRISIIVMTKRAEAAALKQDVPAAPPVAASEPAPAILGDEVPASATTANGG